MGEKDTNSSLLQAVRFCWMGHPNDYVIENESRQPRPQKQCISICWNAFWWGDHQAWAAVRPSYLSLEETNWSPHLGTWAYPFLAVCVLVLMSGASSTPQFLRVAGHLPNRRNWILLRALSVVLDFPGFPLSRSAQHGSLMPHRHLYSGPCKNTQKSPKQIPLIFFL